MATLQDVKDFSKEELRSVLAASGHPPYRVSQIFRWIYKEGAVGFNQMVNLPLGLRAHLAKNFSISRTRLLDRRRSRVDGTTKYLLGLEDSHAIETVYLPEKGRGTVCVSSQVGCRHMCAFCASSVLGFVRNLRSGEILNEVLFVKARERLPVTHVVFMGIGEPLDNYENVMKSVRMLNDRDGLGIGARRITISTCGIIPGIERLSRESLQVELSVSLHSADGRIRSTLVPVNRRYPLRELLAACREYVDMTNRVITFEYVLMKGLNSGTRDAERLTALIKGMKCKVNLISYNQIKALGYEAPSAEEARDFLETLLARGVRAMLRKSRGEDIDAGCGQLRISRIQGE
jgi:23S rRNA (adenine2503-C2)-methyltransferase